MNKDLIELKNSIDKDFEELNKHLERMKLTGISEHSFYMYESGLKFGIFYMDCLKKRIEFLIKINEA